jgi:hypothetical protein
VRQNFYLTEDAILFFCLFNYWMADGKNLLIEMGYAELLFSFVLQAQRASVYHLIP